MVDGELREGYCLELLSLCHQYVMLAEILRGVGKLLDFPSFFFAYCFSWEVWESF